MDYRWPAWRVSSDLLTLNTGRDHCLQVQGAESLDTKTGKDPRTGMSELFTKTTGVFLHLAVQAPGTAIGIVPTSH